MIEPEGLKAFQQALARMAEALRRYPRIAQVEVGRVVDEALLVLAGAAADYPPAPGDSTYRRGGTLGRLWTGGARVVTMGGSGAFVVGRVGNAVPYGSYVQSPERQARVHRGRWQTTEDVVQENAAMIAGMFGEAGDAIMARIAQEGAG